jgi:hypothetical protein
MDRNKLQDNYVDENTDVDKVQYLLYVNLYVQLSTSSPAALICCAVSWSRATKPRVWVGAWRRGCAIIIFEYLVWAGYVAELQDVF